MIEKDFLDMVASSFICACLYGIPVSRFGNPRVTQSWNYVTMTPLRIETENYVSNKNVVSLFTVVTPTSVSFFSISDRNRRLMCTCWKKTWPTPSCGSTGKPATRRCFFRPGSHTLKLCLMNSTCDWMHTFRTHNIRLLSITCSLANRTTCI